MRRRLGVIVFFKQSFGLVAVLFAATIGSTALHSQSASTITVKPVSFGLFHPLDIDPFITINAAFSPDGNTVYYSKSHAGWAGLTIFESHLVNGRWSEPEVSPFSGIFRDTDPFVAPDGKSIVFASMRDAQGHASKTYSLFRVSLDSGAAKPAESLGSAINDGSTALYPSVARDGTIYFMRSVNKTAKIARSEFKDGAYSKTELLDIPGDSATVFDSDPTIAPDQSFVVFASNRPDSLGSNDLYVSFHREQEWCAPIHLDAPVNSPGPELATGLSPDGRTLYFASSRNILEQPRQKRASASDFRAEGDIYENGTVRTYQADLGPWLDSHRPDANSCTAK
jgi:Tol biopolymer transport system component